MRRKFLSVLLAMSMVLTLLPATAWAEVTGMDVARADATELTYGDSGLKETGFTVTYSAWSDGNNKTVTATVLNADDDSATEAKTENISIEKAAATSFFVDLSGLDAGSYKLQVVDSDDENLGGVLDTLEIGQALPTKISYTDEEEVVLYSKTASEIAVDPAIVVADEGGALAGSDFPTIVIAGVKDETHGTAGVEIGEIEWYSDEEMNTKVDTASIEDVTVDETGTPYYWKFAAAADSNYKEDASIKGSVTFKKAEAQNPETLTATFTGKNLTGTAETALATDSSAPTVTITLASKDAIAFNAENVAKADSYTIKYAENAAAPVSTITATGDAGAKTITLTFSGIPAAASTAAFESIEIAANVFEPVADGVITAMPAKDATVAWNIAAKGSEPAGDKFTVGGTVNAGTTGVDSVENITVTLYAKADTEFRTSLGTGKTNVAGKYTISGISGEGVAAGDYVVVVAAGEGYGQSTAEVEVVDANVEDADITLVAAAQKTVKSISAVLKDGKTYEVGGTVAVGDITVTATYTDNTTAVITEGFTLEGNTDLVAGENTITVKLTANEAITATLKVTVAEPLITAVVSGTLAFDGTITYGDTEMPAGNFNGVAVKDANNSETVITGTWAWKDGEAAKITAAGDTAFTAVFTPNGDFEGKVDLTTPITADVTINVAKAEPVVTVDAQSMKKTTAALTKIVTEVNGIVDGDVLTTAGFAWFKDAARENPAADADLTGAGGDTVTLYYTYTPSGAAAANYKAVDGSVVITLTDKSVLTFKFPEATQKTATFGDAPITNPVTILIDSEAPADGQTTVAYSSSDDTIATVADGGVVTILKSGTVTITATVTGTGVADVMGDTTASYALTIAKKAVAITAADQSIDLANDEEVAIGSGSAIDGKYTVSPAVAGLKVTLALRDDADATVVGEYAGAIEVTYEFEPADPDAADKYDFTVTNGKLTVTDSNQSGSAVESVAVSPKTLSLKVGGSSTLTATVTPDGAASVTWTSSNPSVATVDATGKVTAVAAGSAVITATAGDKTDTCDVTVEKKKSSSSSSSSGGGGGASTSSSTVTIASDGNSVKADVKVSSNGTATVSKVENISKVIDDGVVSIDLSGQKTDVDTVKVDSSIVNAIANSDDNEGLEIKLSDGTVTFDADAVASLKGGDLTVKLDKTNSNSLNSKQKDAVKDMDVQGHYELTFNKALKDGEAEVRIPFTVPADKDASDMVLVRVSESGEAEEVSARFSSDEVRFTATESGDYVIAAKAAQASEPAAPTTPVQPAADFKDVEAGAWYGNAVNYVVANGLMSGVGDGSFAPNTNLSRAMLAQILYNQAGRPAAGESAFNDVASGMWYSSAVAWATAQGVVSGYGDGMFGPNDNITREQLAVMLYRFAGSPAADGSLDSFADAGRVSSYAQNALVWATTNGIMSGKGAGNLDPAGQATRAEVAQMLYNYLNK